MTANLLRILNEARACTVCASSLPLGAKPLLAAHSASRILIIGQAPGKATHEAGIPWRDRSGDRLRDWLGVSHEQFYDPRQIALVPTGFCYPGTGATGDLPPRPECAPLWHPRILPLLGGLQLTIYLGSFAFSANLGGRYRNLSSAAEDFRATLPTCIVLPHPSPRNGMWAIQRPWFNSEMLPALRERVKEVLTADGRPGIS
jgi:uracil-DNA glycosylase